MCVAMIHEYPIAFACKAYLSSAFVVALFTCTHTHKHSSEWFWMWQSCERRFLALKMLYAIADDLCAHKCRLAMQILFMKTNHKKFNKKRLGADFKCHTNHNNEIWDKCKPKYRNQCD